MTDYFFELKKLNNRLESAVQHMAKKEGVEFLGGPQGRVLRYLHGHEDQDIFIKDIEQKLNISKSVASNLIKRMEKNGFVEIETSASDKRSKRIVLSDLARAQVNKIPPFIEEFHRALLKDIAQEDLEIFLKVAKKIYANLDELEGEADA